MLRRSFLKCTYKRTISSPILRSSQLFLNHPQTPIKLAHLWSYWVAVGVVAASCEELNETENGEKKEDEETVGAGKAQKSLPTFRLSQVEQHVTTTGACIDVWVIFKNGVYDISKFIAAHPGGANKICLAAGKSIEPFWELYAAHHHIEVYRILEGCRVGNLHADDVELLAKQSACTATEGPYACEPIRHPALKVNSKTPFNAEPPPELLMTSFITPPSLFFVRNHLPVPKLTEEYVNDTYRFKVAGVAGSEHVIEFTLEELKSMFAHVTIITTLQCAGNRRAEMSNVKAVKGLSWDTTAIGTAAWTGVRLSDVLAHVGISQNEDGGNKERQHVHLEGMDKGVDGKGYGASIPISTATDPRKDVLLAFEMNGAPIPRDHGYPLRAIVPGTVGARNVKYLEKIVISAEESGSFWQQKDYKGFPPNIDYTTEEYWKKAGPSIQELPVQSAITEPAEGMHVARDESLTIRGYAWSGGGRGIVRVDVSIDGGKAWSAADLDEDGTSQKYNRAWAWTPWEIDVDLSEVSSLDAIDICCKAIDSSYNSQPDTISPIWNMRGVLNNAWHIVHVFLKSPENNNNSE